MVPPSVTDAVPSNAADEVPIGQLADTNSASNVGFWAVNAKMFTLSFQTLKIKAAMRCLAVSI